MITYCAQIGSVLRRDHPIYVEKCPTLVASSHGGGTIRRLFGVRMTQIVMTRSWGGSNAYKELTDISETVQAAYGMGGGNTPLVIEEDDNEEEL